jgi:hypothetical protein
MGIYDHTARKGEGDLALYVNSLLEDKALISLKAVQRGQTVNNLYTGHVPANLTHLPTLRDRI